MIKKKIKKNVDKFVFMLYNNIRVKELHEWLSGGVSPCQGEGRGFESRLALRGKKAETFYKVFRFFVDSTDKK